jgi:hypothetical protein
MNKKYIFRPYKNKSDYELINLYEKESSLTFGMNIGMIITSMFIGICYVFLSEVLVAYSLILAIIVVFNYISLKEDNIKTKRQELVKEILLRKINKKYEISNNVKNKCPCCNKLMYKLKTGKWTHLASKVIEEEYKIVNKK